MTKQLYVDKEAVYNTVVFGCFQGAQSSRRNCASSSTGEPSLAACHYFKTDTMYATSTTTLFLHCHWAGESDTFGLTAHDSYLYVCGVADNKGPILAIACAAVD